jgi:SsrA-binding protein
MKKKRAPAGLISNRRATFDYDLGDKLTVGISLSGAETKALRMGHGNLRGAYVVVKDNELWLLNATISGTTGIPISESNQTRSRKLLAKRREIDALIAAKHEGKSIVPTAVLTRGRFIKLQIAVGKGKKLYDKRQTLKARDQARDIRAHGL